MRRSVATASPRRRWSRAAPRRVRERRPASASSRRSPTRRRSHSAPRRATTGTARHRHHRGDDRRNDRVDGRRHERARPDRPPRWCRSTTPTRRRARSTSTSPATSPTPKQRIGSLLVNPGGPGFGGSDFAPAGRRDLQRSRSLDRFDIVGWDPRGTGLTTPTIDCIDDYDHFFAGTDITPDTPQERQQIVDLAKEFADDCVTKNARVHAVRRHQQLGPRHGHASAQRSARRRSATSGSATAASSVPRGPRCSPPPCAPRCSTARSTPTPTARPAGIAAERGLRAGAHHVPRRTAAPTPKCPFHNGGDAEGAFDALMTSHRRPPDRPPRPGAPTSPARWRSPRWRQAMYTPALWPELQTALADAQNGDGTGAAAPVRRVLPAPAPTAPTTTRSRRSR